MSILCVIARLIYTNAVLGVITVSVMIRILFQNNLILIHRKPQLIVLPVHRKERIQDIFRSNKGRKFTCYHNQ